MVEWVSQLFPFGAPHRAALALFHPLPWKLAAKTTALAVHGSVASLLPYRIFQAGRDHDVRYHVLMFRNTRVRQGPECLGGQGTAQTSDAQSSLKAARTWHFQHSSPLS